MAGSRDRPTLGSLMRRVVVTAQLKPGSLERVREILREGPPFDLASTSLERHQVFLGADQLVFLFEGSHADEEVSRVLRDLRVLGRAGRLARHLERASVVPMEVFGWERCEEMEGVSFGAQPGPGDSDGG